MSERFKSVNMLDSRVNILIAHVVPEEHHPLGPTSEPGSIHNVRLTVQNRLQQSRIFPGVVFEISVLYQDDVTRNLCKAGTQGGPLALIDRMLDKDGSPPLQPFSISSNFAWVPSVEASLINQDLEIHSLLNRELVRRVSTGLRPSLPRHRPGMTTESIRHIASAV